LRVHIKTHKVHIKTPIEGASHTQHIKTPIEGASLLDTVSERQCFGCLWYTVSVDRQYTVSVDRQGRPIQTPIESVSLLDTVSERQSVGCLWYGVSVDRQYHRQPICILGKGDYRQGRPRHSLRTESPRDTVCVSPRDTVSVTS